MPKDLYRWEDCGGLVHHCPVCAKPLTNPQARTRCLGEHVECCKGYHTQLFRKGLSSQCNPCRRTDEEHRKRHIEIAEILLELKQTSAGLSPPVPTLLKAGDTWSDTSHSADEKTPKSTKKERKALKRSQKLLERKKNVTSADVDFVASVLHPRISGAQDIDLELQLVEDPSMKINRAYHKGTSNVREMRCELIQKDKAGNEVKEPCIKVEEMDQILVGLSIPPLTARSSSKEKSLHRHLMERIGRDIAQEQKEVELLTVRKAGFWRWASKRVYDRFIENRRLEQDQERSCEHIEEPPDSITENRVEEDDSSAKSSSATVVKESSDQIGKQAVTSVIKLVRNSGLEKLAQPMKASPRPVWSCDHQFKFDSA